MAAWRSSLLHDEWTLCVGSGCFLIKTPLTKVACSGAFFITGSDQGGVVWEWEVRLNHHPQLHNYCHCHHDCNIDIRFEEVQFSDNAQGLIHNIRCGESCTYNTRIGWEEKLKKVWFPVSIFKYKQCFLIWSPPDQVLHLDFDGTWVLAGGKNKLKFWNKADRFSLIRFFAGYLFVDL